MGEVESGPGGAVAAHKSPWEPTSSRRWRGTPRTHGVPALLHQRGCCWYHWHLQVTKPGVLGISVTVTQLVRCTVSIGVQLCPTPKPMPPPKNWIQSAYLQLFPGSGLSLLPFGWTDPLMVSTHPIKNISFQIVFFQLYLSKKFILHLSDLDMSTHTQTSTYLVKYHLLYIMHSTTFCYILFF